MATRRKTTKKAVKKTRKTTAKRTIKKKTKAKKGTKRTAFGGYTINFNNCEHSLEDIFGKKPLAPSEMTKKLWAYVKRYKLNQK